MAIFVFSVLIVGMPTFFASAAETANNNENTYQSCTTSAGTTGYVSPSTGHCVPSMDAGKKEVLPCPSGQQYDASGICVASTASTTNSTGATGGLIPCGRDGQSKCTLCHFVVGFKGLIDFGMKIVVGLAIAAIFVSGIMYILAFTDEGMVKNAKEMLTGTLKGFAFVMLGWLIVNVTLWVLSANVSMGQSQTKNWYEISCDTK